MNTSTTRNTALGTAAAIAAATGIYFATSTSDEAPAPAATFSIQEYLPEIPGVSLDLPTLPASGVPSAVLPENYLPTTEAPVADMPQTDAPIADTPKTNAPKTDAPVADAPDASSPKVDTPESGAVEYAAALARAIELDAALQGFFRDQRSIEYDARRYDNPHLDKWLAIYRMYANVTVEKVSLKNSIRMITEVRMPKTGDGYRILADNLAYYKSRGYDAALLTFYGTESPDELLDLARRIRAAGLAVWFAYSGPERLQHSIFIDPARLRGQIRALAPISDGMLLGWRRTSPHLFLADAPYMAFVASCARQTNPSIPIVGEFYVGNTAEHPHEGQFGIGVNCPSWASAAIVMNFGYLNVSQADALALARRHLPKGMALLGASLGEWPYYLSLHPTGKSQETNQQIKETIEKRFAGAGALGTITLHDDGRDGVGREPINNNLAETPFAELK